MIKSIFSAIMFVVMGFSAPVIFTSCQNMGGVSQYVTDAEAWLNNPANIQLITSIANAALSILSGFGKTGKTATYSEKATCTGKLSVQFPNVPAGAIAKIVSDPTAYLKK